LTTFLRYVALRLGLPTLHTLHV